MKNLLAKGKEAVKGVSKKAWGLGLLAAATLVGVGIYAKNRADKGANEVVDFGAEESSEESDQ